MLPSTGKYVYDKWSAAAGFPNTSFWVHKRLNKQKYQWKVQFRK